MDDQPSKDQKSGPAAGRDPLRASRTSRSWLSLTALVVVLILLVVFIAQNTQKVQVSFLGWKGHPPLSVALLIAAVAGATLAVIVATLRIWQVRRRVRRSG
ncbi:MAG TPA: LapA family protein [Nocardioides sp.]|jgi:uncharacterized integral membrane protein|nr:LapA family protein [Nocardioides sp.]